MTASAPTADPGGRWNAVEELFYRALDLDSAERDAFLDAACAGDAELRQEVASLLAARDRAAGDETGSGTRDPIEELVRRSAAAVVEPPAGASGERRVGRYRLLRELGHGGMGVVWLGERADGAYDQKVAVKLVRGHVAGEEARRRFRTERQVLARLQHPVIARLLDGGATDDGTPYLVMEYVDGEPIHEHCRRRELSVEERLRLFLEVCDAVDSAHRQLVVHRDLKPSNVLVDNDGRPRLLDFGIAKLLDDEEEAGPTRTVERRLTPGYASPEQVLGGPITTASDVYSLGAMLYELLAGRPAFPSAEMTPAKLLDAVVTHSPPRPSVAAGLPRLGGELDAIVLTALRKEPERRYPSVAALAEDVQRHLAGLPVAAHSERWTYLAGKWLRRHAALAAAAALVVLALAGGLVARTLEAQRAEREAATAERVSEFLVDLLAEADPGSARGRDLTVLEAVDRGAERVERELADDPLIQARLLHVIGEVYKQRGAYEEAERTLRRALALRRLHGAGPAEIAESLDGIGDLQLKLSRFDEAEQTLRRALAIREAMRPPDPEGLSNTQTFLGLTLDEVGRLDEAEALFRSALELRRGVFGEEHEAVAKSLNNLALVLSGRGQVDAAGEAHEQVVELKRRILPPDHPSLAVSLQNLAVNYSLRGLHDRGIAAQAEALELMRRVHGGRHPLYVQALAEMASQLHDQRRWDEAEDAYREALALQTEIFPNGHADTTLTLNNLASLLEDRGDPAAAEPLFVESLALRRRLYGDDHPAVARALHNLARVRRRLDRTDEAEALYRESLATWRRVRPAGHADVGKTAHHLGELLVERGRPGEAEPLLAEAAAIAGRGSVATPPPSSG